MNEEPVERPRPHGAPVEEDDVGPSTEEEEEEEEKNGALENAPEAAAARRTLALVHKPDPRREVPAGVKVKEEPKPDGAEPPVDWFEPLEDDDDGLSRNDPEDESLAGESERSESVAGSEKAHRKTVRLHVPRRKRSHPDEGWSDWSALGDGWKRKEVVRRSGSSIGQTDVYYMSPRGDRVRSRVDLVSMLEGFLDLSAFDYKSGKFYAGKEAPTRVRNRVKRLIRERSSSESSWVDRGEGADTPDSFHRLTPVPGPKAPPHSQLLFPSHAAAGPLSQRIRSDDPRGEDRIKLPLPSSSARLLPLPSINGEIGSEDSTLICAKCGISFTGTWYDKQRKRPCCPSCWAASKNKEHPMIRFRKWIPCGQCVGCHNTVNCGQCANCKHGLQSPESRKRVCRKRKCICPIRKSPGSGNFPQQRPYNDFPETFDDSMSFQSEVTDSQHMSLKSSDTENFSLNVDVDDDDDMSTDDDDDWHKKRKRRSCGECKACLCRKDCGTCDFCVDKPKFGGSNKKRQKCRLRQCQRQAMRHLLPFQMGQGDFGSEGAGLPGRPRPHYTYSRKSTYKRNRGGTSGGDFTDNEDDDLGVKPLNHLDLGRNGLPERDSYLSNHSCDPEQMSRWEAEKSHAGAGKHGDEDDEEEEEDEDDEEEDEDFPTITQIFSLADNPAGGGGGGGGSSGGGGTDQQLLKLLQSLRSSVLPILWYAIMVDGPQLQLIQCSKQSHMTDTTVLIDPGFCYQVTVQKQPLLPTHPLYDRHPGRLSSVAEVVSLLLGLEKYGVCQGLPLPPRQQAAAPRRTALILERASTCDFLVRRKVSVCSNCRALQGR